MKVIVRDSDGVEYVAFDAMNCGGAMRDGERVAEAIRLAIRRQRERMEQQERLASEKNPSAIEAVKAEFARLNSKIETLQAQRDTLLTLVKHGGHSEECLATARVDGSSPCIPSCARNRQATLALCGRLDSIVTPDPSVTIETASQWVKGAYKRAKGGTEL